MRRSICQIVRTIAACGILAAQAAPASAAESCDVTGLTLDSYLMGGGAVDITDRLAAAGKSTMEVRGREFAPTAVYLRPRGPIVTVLGAMEAPEVAEIADAPGLTRELVRRELLQGLEAKAGCQGQGPACTAKALEGDVIGVESNSYDVDQQGKRTRSKMLLMITPPQCMVVVVAITAADGPAAASTWRLIEADFAKIQATMERIQVAPFWER